MIDMIRDVFGLYGYQRMDNSEIDFFIPVSNDLKSYWSVVEVDPEVLLNDQGDLLSKYQDAFPEPAVAKNTNIICLWKVNKVNDVTIRMVHKVEEDPYFFKKHVLYYTDNEKNSFSQEIKNSSLLNVMQCAVDTNVFEKYKTDVYADSWQSLLYRLCIKLTFITIENVNSGDISDLIANLEKKFSNTKRPDYVKVLDSIVMNIERGDGVSGVDPETMLGNILLKLEKAGHEI
jgi:hypothetical protein